MSDSPVRRCVRRIVDLRVPVRLALLSCAPASALAAAPALLFATTPLLPLFAPLSPALLGAAPPPVEG